MVPTITTEIEIQNTDASFDDPGGQAESISVPKIQQQALHSWEDDTHSQAAARLNYMMVKCNDQDLQDLCRRPPFNIRCADGCDFNTICAIMVDRPHVLCESECTCIAANKATIPTFNEFADLE